MSWSMCLAWPEICSGADEFNEDEADKQDTPLLPTNWAAWRAAMEDEPALKEELRRAGCAALLSYYTEGLEPNEIDWVSPHDLASAASALKELILRSSDDLMVLEILRLYAAYSYDDARPREAFCDDLDVIARTARWAASLGHARVTLDLGP